MGTGKPILPCTAGRIRPSISIRWSITNIGGANCPRWICHLACSARISQPTASGRGASRLATGFASAAPRLWPRRPRLPCYKLGVKFQSDDMVKRFLESGRTGFFYGAVLREGEVGAGDSIEVTARDERQVPVPEITRLYITKRYNRADLETVRRATEVPALPESWRSYFRTRLENAQLRLP